MGSLSRKKTGIMLLVLCFFCLSFFSCQRSVPLSVPGRSSRDRFVLDEADMLSGETEEYLTEKDGSLRKACGAEIVVVCLPDLGGVPISDYAGALFDKWEAGGAEEQKGVLLLLAKEEDDYWVYQGKGLETLLTDPILKVMLAERLEPFFAQKAYDEGVTSVFDAIVSHLEAAYAVSIAEYGAQVPPLPAETLPLIELPVAGDAPVSSQGGDIMFSLFKNAVIFIAVLLVVLILIAAVVAVFLVRKWKQREAVKGNRPPPPRQNNRNPYSSTYTANRPPQRPPAGNGGAPYQNVRNRDVPLSGGQYGQTNFARSSRPASPPPQRREGNFYPENRTSAPARRNGNGIVPPGGYGRR